MLSVQDTKTSGGEVPGKTSSCQRYINNKCMRKSRTHCYGHWLPEEQRVELEKGDLRSQQRDLTNEVPAEKIRL